MIIITEFPETKTGSNFKKLQKQDKMAKKVGKLVGRYIDEPWADGNAFYVIVKENKTSVRIRVVTGIGDDWIILQPPNWLFRLKQGQFTNSEIGECSQRHR